jgi:hypothetical protein
MSDETQAKVPVEPTLDDILAQYIAGEEAGRPVDRELLAYSSSLPIATRCSGWRCR